MRYFGHTLIAFFFLKQSPSTTGINKEGSSVTSKRFTTFLISPFPDLERFSEVALFVAKTIWICLYVVSVH